ncbi:hypothetical protein Tco_0331309 [Tanacetum coccineum]
MAALKFAETHNLVAFLEKPDESDGFEQIVDFLNAHTIKHALTINPTIYTSCIEQFWATAKVKIVNGDVQLQTLVDGKKMIITEASVRIDLHLEDAEGTECLPTATIFEELTRIGYEKLTQKLTFYKTFFSPQWKFLIHTILQCLSAKTTAWNEFNSIMASTIICLAKNQKFNFSKYIFDNMVKNLEGEVKFQMYPRFVQLFVNQQLGDMSHHKNIFVTSSHTKKVFGNIKMEGKGFSGRVTPLFPTMIVQAHEEKKQPRRKQRKGTEIPSSSGEPIADEAANEEHVPTHSNNPLLSGEDRLKLNELMELCTQLQNRVLNLENTKTTQAQEITSLKKRVKKLERRKKSRTQGLKRMYKVGLSAKIISSDDESLGDQEDASKQERIIDNIDADEGVTLVDETQGKNDKEIVETVEGAEYVVSGVLDGEEVFAGQDMDEKEVSVIDPVTTAGEVVTTVSTTATITPEEVTLAQALVKEKAEDEERIAREKQEANVALVEEWNDIQAKIKADQLLAERLQAREQEELKIDERAKLFQQLLEKRRNFFAAKRAEEKRNKPPTKAQKRSIMSTYLKNIAGYKHNQLKNKGFNDIQGLFDKEMKRVNTFMDMDTELVKGTDQKESSKKAKVMEENSSKREGEELRQEKAKKQKIDDDQEESEMKKHMEIVHDKEEVAIDAIPLATKPPIIVDWKIIKEGKIGYFQIIRADGSSKRYSLMIQMLQSINKEDLETLWKQLKAKHGSTRPEEGYERVL